MKRVSLIILILATGLFSKEVTLNLSQAIDLALENNGLNKISKLNLKVADAQYQQALSANYPSLDAIFYANRDDQDTIYQQRGTFTLPSEFSKTLALANTLAIPEDAPGIFATREATQAGIAAAPLSSFPEGSISADIDTVAKGRDTLRGQLELNYPIYTGGKISAIIEQARLNKSIAMQGIIRDKNSIVFDVKKYYYGYILKRIWK